MFACMFVLGTNLERGGVFACLAPVHNGLDAEWLRYWQLSGLLHRLNQRGQLVSRRKDKGGLALC